VQRIPLSDEYDADEDFASGIGDPLDELIESEERVRLNAEESKSLPSMIEYEAVIAAARRSAKRNPVKAAIRPSRQHGC
jgi:hypothetical protein